MWEYNKTLTHHGIKGQKWGVRRYQNPDGSLTSAGKKRTQSSNGKVQTAEEKRKADMRSAVKNRRTLSDKELRERIERLKLEKQLKELTNSEINKGRTFVSEIMSSTGKKVLTTMATGAILYGVKSATSGKFDIKELGSYMTPKPKSK